MLLYSHVECKVLVNTGLGAASVMYPEWLLLLGQALGARFGAASAVSGRLGLRWWSAAVVAVVIASGAQSYS